MTHPASGRVLPFYRALNGMRPAAAALVLLFIGAATTHAQQPAQQPPTCDTPEHRAFDFWIGDWDVTNPRGNVAGTNRIEPILSGCVLQESWTGASGSLGYSFNLYDRASGTWHQTWVDNSGLLLQLSGGLVDGSMVLASDAAAGSPLQRITWTPNADGSVRQHWESSSDGGATWTTVFDGLYRTRVR